MTEPVDPALPAAPGVLRRAADAARSAWTVCWRALALATLWGGLLAPAVLLLRRRLEAARAEAAGDPARLALEAFGALALLLATLVLVRLVERRPLAWAGLGAVRFGRDAAGGVGGGALWLAASLLPLALAGWVSLEPAGAFSWTALAVSGAAIAANAFTQELLFRGYPFQLLLRAAGPGVAVAVTSALFSASHLPAFRGAWLPAVNVALAGALFGVALLRTGTLWLPIAMHAAWNFLAGPALGLSVSGRGDLGAGWRVLALHGPALATGGAFGVEGSLATTLVTAAAIALVLGRRGRAPALSAPSPPPAS